MIQIETKLDIFVGETETSIYINDVNAGIRFAEITISNAKLLQAIARTGRVESICLIRDIERIGKKLSVNVMTFEMPNDCENLKESAYELAKKVCPSGWIVENYFGSQGSFFRKDGKAFCNATIRKWE
jgi:hypothetical protein